MATIQELIAAKKARIEARIGFESDLTDDLLDELVRLRQSESSLGVASAVVDPASIGSGIDSSTEILAVKNSLVSILSELVNTKAFADLMVRDSLGSYFVRREVADQSTGIITVGFFNLDNTLGTPVGAVVPLKNGGGDSIVENKYYTLVGGAGFNTGDSLANILIVDGETRAVSSLGWFNITSGVPLAVAPGSSAVKGYEDLVEELLAKIVALLPLSLGAKTSAGSLSVTFATDTTFPAVSGGATSTNQAEEILRLEAIKTSVALVATEQTLLSARNRLAAIEQNTLTPNIRPLTATDVVTVNAPDLATAIGQTAATNKLASIDGKLTTPNIRALTISDVVTVGALPAAVAADIAAIRVNTGRISQYQFQLVTDSTSTVFVARYDTVAGSVSNFTLAGASYTPSGAIKISDASGGSGVTLALEIDEFESITTSGTNWTIGDILTRVLIINTSTGAISSTIWQSATGATLATAPALGTDVVDTDKQQLALLRQIYAQLSTQNVATSLVDRHIVGAAFQHPVGANALAATANTFAALDITGFRSFSIQVSSSQNIASIWVLEGSDDNVNFTPTPCVDRANPNATLVGFNTFSSSPITYIGNRAYRYLRLRVLNPIGAGTVQALTTLSPLLTNLLPAVSLVPGTTIGSQLTPTSNTVDASAFLTSAPTSGVNTASFSPTWGTAISFAYTVVISNAGSNAYVSVQESNDDNIWSDLHTWPILASTGNSYFRNISPIFAVTSRFYRFRYASSANAGGTWDFTLSHNQSNLSPTIPTDIWIDTQASANADVCDPLVVSGKGTASFTLKGTWSGTFQVQISTDGVAWSSLNANNAVYNPATKTFLSGGNIDANGIYEVSCAGLKAVRLRSLSGGVGLANISIRAAVASNIVAIEGQVNTRISNGAIDVGVIAANTANSPTTNALSISIRPDSNVGISALPGTVAADIAAIRVNTTRISQYQFQLVTDSTSTVFVARYDTVTGSVSNFTLAGAGYTPSGAIKISDASGGGGVTLALEIDEFESITTSGTNWTIGDILTRVLIVNTSTGAISSTIWQSAAGATLATAPVLGTDVVDTDKQQLAILRTSIGLPADAASASDGATGSIISALKRLNSKFVPGAQTAYAGLGVALSKKQTFSGFASSSSLSNNLLNFSSGAPTLVDIFSSCEVVLSSPTGGWQYAIETALDVGFTIGVKRAQYVDSLGVSQLAVGTVFAGSDLQIPVDLIHANYFRIRMVSSVASANATAVFNQFPLSASKVLCINPTQNLGTISQVSQLGAISDATVNGSVVAVATPACAISLNGRGVVNYSLSGSWVGAVQVQVSMDTGSWYNLSATNAVYDVQNKVFVSGGNITSNGIYQVNVGGLGYVRLIATVFGGGGVANIFGRASNASSLVTIEGQVNAQISNTNLVVSGVNNVTGVDVVASATLSPARFLPDVGFTTLAGSTVNSVILPVNSAGLSYTIDVVVLAISGSDTVYTLVLQDSADDGTNWRNIYVFEPITTAKGPKVYRSALLPATAGKLRVLQTLTGTTPSVTRTLSRSATNISVPIALATTRSGASNLVNTGFDFPLYGRTRRIVSTNTTATLYYWQFHDSAVALVAGAIPLAAEVYQLPPTSTLAFTSADLGEHGTVFGVNPRIALSTTFAIYTPISSVAANSITLFVESL